ncbi:MAG: alpha/beta fold hydrolase, partial [Acidimicrobiales bacterium]
MPPRWAGHDLWTVQHFVREVEVVRSALDLDRFHLFGSSWGGQLSMQYVLDYHAQLFAELPAEVQHVITRHERTGFTSCPEYIGAVNVFYKRHLCRLDPWPPGLERTFAEMSQVVYETMNGPSEFTVTGRFRDWDIFDRLGEIRVPTLVMSGR